MERTKTILLSQSKEGISPHRDEAIRSFNGGLLLAWKDNPDLEREYEAILGSRKDSDSKHNADLIARSIQYELRKEGISDYGYFDEDQWRKQILSLDMNSDTLRIHLEHGFVATHRIERYRGLCAFYSLLSRLPHHTTDVTDWGASLGLGMLAITKRGYLIDTNNGLPTLTDMTKNQIVQESISSGAVETNAGLLIAVDKQKADIEWAAAGVYFMDYERERKLLDSIQKDLAQFNTRQDSIIADVSDPRFIEAFGFKENFDIVHSSMMMWQLNQTDRLAVEHNASLALKNNGFLVELTIKEEGSYNTERNILTTVRRKCGQKLSDKKVWLIWKNSFCTEVREGEDFDEINSWLF